MKSWPETELWKKIKERLGNYEEEPDDQWDLIMAGVNSTRQQSTSAMTWSLRIMLVLLIAYLFIPENTSLPSLKLASDMSSSIAEMKLLESMTNRNMILNEDASTGSSSMFDDDGDGFRVHGTGDNNSNLSIKIDRNPTKTLGITEQNAGARELSGEKNFTRDVVGVQSNRADTLYAAYVVEDTVRHTDWANSAENIEKNDKNIATPEDTIQVRMTSSLKEKRDRKKRPLQIYLSITPSLSYYKLTPDRHDQITMKEVRPSGIFSTDRLGVSLDAGIHRPVARKLAWFAGVTYYQQQQTIRYTALTEDVGSVTSHDGDYTITPRTSLRTVSYSMHNAGLSAGLLYTLKTSILQHQIGAGVQFHYGLSRSSSENSIKNDSQLYLNYQVHYRFSWKASNTIDFYVQPAYTQGLFDQKVNTQPFSVTPSRAGIGFGIVYHVR